MPEITLMSAPCVATIPVDECGEPLVDLREVAAIRLDPRLADTDGAYAHVRLSVVDRLVAAQTLLPRGLRLLVVEGHRPAAVQEQYFAESVAALRTLHPEWTATRTHREASRYISPPEVAPHVAGAAVDLTLCTDDGLELDLGTQVNATPTEGDGACYTASTAISPPARENRRALGAALTATGFVNYPTEWWHWSYGDRYWAYLTGTRSARYGPR